MNSSSGSTPRIERERGGNDRPECPLDSGGGEWRARFAGRWSSYSSSAGCSLLAMLAVGGGQCSRNTRERRPRNVVVGEASVYGRYPAWTWTTTSPHSTMLRITRFSSLALATACRGRGLATSTVQLPLQSHGHLPTSQSPITPKLHFFNSVLEDGKQIPTFRILDSTGQPIEGAELPEVC